MSVVASPLEFCKALGFRSKLGFWFENQYDISVYTCWPVTAILCHCGLILCNNTFSLAADERFTSLHAGGSASSRGWLCFGEAVR